MYVQTESNNHICFTKQINQQIKQQIQIKTFNRVHTPRGKAISRTFPGLFQDSSCTFPGPFDPLKTLTTKTY